MTNVLYGKILCSSQDSVYLKGNIHTLTLAERLFLEFGTTIE